MAARATGWTGTSSLPWASRTLMHGSPTCLDTYRCSKGLASRIADTYNPFAVAVGLPQAAFSKHPTEGEIIREAVREHQPRLRQEIEIARPDTIVTLAMPRWPSSATSTLTEAARGHADSWRPRSTARLRPSALGGATWNCCPLRTPPRRPRTGRSTRTGAPHGDACRRTVIPPTSYHPAPGAGPFHGRAKKFRSHPSPRGHTRDTLGCGANSGKISLAGAQAGVLSTNRTSR